MTTLQLQAYELISQLNDTKLQLIIDVMKNFTSSEDTPNKQKRLIKERKRIESKIKREKFLSENKDMTIFCRHCNEHLPASEFSLVFRNKKGTPEFQCKKCKRRKRRIQSIDK